MNVKNITYAILFLLLTVSCEGIHHVEGVVADAETQLSIGGALIIRNKTDTLSVLPLNRKKHKEFKVLYLRDLETNNYVINSTRRIELTENNKIKASLKMPIPDEEVKNFSVSKIAETRHGFKIAVNWGGGNYLYDIEYYFILREKSFYLDYVKFHTYSPNSKVKTTIKRITPKIPIEKFDIMQCLESR